MENKMFLWLDEQKKKFNSIQYVILQTQLALFFYLFQDFQDKTTEIGKFSHINLTEHDINYMKDDNNKSRNKEDK